MTLHETTQSVVLALRVHRIYHPPMTHLRITLSIEALRNITDGELLSFSVPDSDLVLTLACDQAVVAAFKNEIQLALLRNLEAAPGYH